MKNEIIIYQPDELIKVEVKIKEDTVWLTQEQMALLFDRSRPAITQHIGNIFKEGELQKDVVCKDFLHTTHHGAMKSKTQSKNVKIYNLDVIISVGYRVKSKRGTQFRIWATKILKDHLLKGYSLNTRMNRIEDKFDTLAHKVEKMDLQINAQLPPNQGIFFEGQIFDAYTFVSDIVRSAKKSIALIDNYIDDSVLNILSKKQPKVKCTILTKNINEKLKQDTKKFNQQYGTLVLKSFNLSHDRFLIVDNQEVYHIGASLKDLGKKWFAFNKMSNKTIQSVLEKIKKLP